MQVTYVFFYRACKAQGLDRRSLPYYGKFQPYCGWISLCFLVMTVFFYGYSCFILDDTVQVRTIARGHGETALLQAIVGILVRTA